MTRFDTLVKKSTKKPAMTTMTIRIPAELKKQITLEADVWKISINKLMILILKHRVEKRRGERK